MSTILEHDNPTKKYEELDARWRRRIVEGEWRPGDRLPTFVELCREYDVSRSTVERVCRSLEKDGLIMRRQGSGTYIAQPKPRRKTNLLGFCGFGFEEKPRPRYWTHIQEGIQEVASREGKSVVLLDHRTLTGTDMVDGLLLGDPLSQQAQQAIQALPADLPRVSLLFVAEGVASVVADDYQGGQIAVDHLLSLGHRRIACLVDTEHALVRRRLAGYRDALHGAGIKPNDSWLRAYGDTNNPRAKFPNFTERSMQVMGDWFREDWQELGCTAIVTQNDQIALGVIKALQDVGVDVPGQVSVMGFDNIELCEYVTPQISSIEVLLHDIGKTGTEILLQQIESGRGTPATTMLPVRLHARESTAPPPHS